MHETMKQMRRRSGSVTIDCKFTSFLYTLMRDHVQPGDIEDIMLNHMSDEPVEYSNGWLALYANDVATRLQSKKFNKEERFKRLTQSNEYIQFIRNKLISEDIKTDDSNQLEFYNILFNALKHCLVFNLDGARLLYEIGESHYNDYVFTELEKEYPEFADA
jgi:hypothetical protein